MICAQPVRAEIASPAANRSVVVVIARYLVYSNI
jgi:hypothetical protein